MFDNIVIPYKNVFNINSVFFFLETGGLFMLAIRLMQLFSENTNDFNKLTGILGLYFQIRDDYCNLCLQEVRKKFKISNYSVSITYIVF